MRLVEHHRVWAAAVVDGQVTGLQQGVPAVLGEPARAVREQPDLVIARVPERDHAPGPRGQVRFGGHPGHQQVAQLPVRHLAAERPAADRRAFQRDERRRDPVPPLGEPVRLGYVIGAQNLSHGHLNIPGPPAHDNM